MQYGDNSIKYPTQKKTFIEKINKKKFWKSLSLQPKISCEQMPATENLKQNEKTMCIFMHLIVLFHILSLY